MADASGVLPRGTHGVDDRVRVLGIDDVEAHDVLGGGLLVALEESFFITMELEDGEPVVGALHVARKGLVDVDNAREVLGALHVTRRPVAVLSESCEETTQGPTYPSCRRLATS